MLTKTLLGPICRITVGEFSWVTAPGAATSWGGVWILSWSRFGIRFVLYVFNKLLIIFVGAIEAIDLNRLGSSSFETNEILRMIKSQPEHVKCSSGSRSASGLKIDYRIFFSWNCLPISRPSTFFGLYFFGSIPLYPLCCIAHFRLRDLKVSLLLEYINEISSSSLNIPSWNLPGFCCSSYLRNSEYRFLTVF